MEKTFEIKEFVESESKKSPFADWFDSLDAITAARVDKYFADLKREILVQPKFFKKVFQN